ncbi:MAG: hypothetical protein J7500_15425 [Sphingomonas sp.]|uniref:hypothetical protein n=1 Tax=Sphingomonas sp. TaxID=28214 RepID=UPI001B1CA83F|nr:hypothetical protein [Sphingomonas sp.]MBO9624098.1 hypothetical protein [Sphingomonas sp.]
MIRRHMFMSAAAATLALASCSGGDDDPTPTPSPSPTSSPSPTPTASPTYTAFPLAAAASFNTINASVSYTGDPAAGAVSLGAGATETLSSRVSLATSNAIATGTYVINEAGEESRFTTTNVTVQPAPAVNEFVFRTDDATTAGKFSQLEFLNNTIPSQVTSTAALQLTNVSYMNWWRGDSTAGAKRFTTGVWGYNTAVGDLPTTGTQAYTATVNGRLISVAGTTTTVTRVSGTVTLSVNFATSIVDITMNLTTPGTGGGAPVPYGTFTAQASWATKSTLFNGSFLQGSPLNGTVAGGFYGSQAKEIGLVFQGSGTFNGANQRLVGNIVGKK